MSDAFVRALMLGCGRGMPKPPASLAALPQIRPDQWLLPTVALLGQQSRHRRPTVPAIDDQAGLPSDQRTIVPAAARPILVRLFSERSGAVAAPPESAAAAVRSMMEQRDLRLHPFDLPRLPKLLSQRPELQQPQERAWLRRASGADANHPVTASEASIDDLEVAPTGVQVAHLHRERVRDAAAARAQLESLLEGRSAAVRARLLECLATALNDQDRTLLEAQLEGRAKSVALVAERLLARLPGTEQHEQRLDALVRDVVSGKSGLLRRKRSFAWKKLDRREDRIRVAVDACIGVDLDALAQRFECTVEALCLGSAGDPAFATGLAVAALVSERDDAIACVARCEDFDWGYLLLALEDHPRRAEWLRELTARCMQPENWPQLPGSDLLEELACTLASPLGDDLGQRLLVSSCLIDAVRTIAASPLEAPERFSLEPLAVLMPRPHRAAFRSVIEPIALADRQRAGQLLDLFDLLDEATI